MNKLKKKIIIKLIGLFAKINFLTYRIISELSTKINKGNHVKHQIMKYENFFIKNIKKTETVLDIGCGTGYVANKISKKAKKVVGIDLNKKSIITARKKTNKKITYLIGDATKFEFDEKFDTIILSNVLEHIKFRVNFLKKITKNTKKILIRVPLITRSWYPVFLKQLKLDYRLDRTHYIEYYEEEIIKEIKDAGLKVEKYEIRWGEIYLVCKK